MKAALLIAISLTVGTAVAQPNNARTGQLAELRFDRGSSELSLTRIERTQRLLGTAAAWAVQNPDGFLVIDGYADHDRERRRAVRLSLARAETVRDQLVRYGVDPDQIVLAAYGGDRQRVVIWGTRAGMDAIVARTLRRGHAVIWNGVITEADRRPSPAVRTQVTFR